MKDFQNVDMAEPCETENRLGFLSTFFSTIAIVIAGLGLCGLAVFNTEQRKKEMGIRGLLCASVRDLISILFKEFVFRSSGARHRPSGASDQAIGAATASPIDSLRYE